MKRFVKLFACVIAAATVFSSVGIFALAETNDDTSADIVVLEFENFEGTFDASVWNGGSGSQFDSALAATKDGWLVRNKSGDSDAVHATPVSDTNGNKYLYWKSAANNTTTKGYSVKKVLINNGVSAPYADASGSTKLVVSYDMKSAYNTETYFETGVGTSNRINRIFFYEHTASKNGPRFASGTSNPVWYMNNTTEGQFYNFKEVIDLKNKTCEVYVNDVKKHIYENISATQFYAFEVVTTAGSSTGSLDNLKIYTIPTSGYTLNATQGDASDLPLNSDFDLSFNGFVKESTLANLVVKANGTPLSADDYTLTSAQGVTESGIAKTDVTVKVNSLDYGTTYTIEIPATVTDEIGNAAAAQTLAYATEAAPSFSVAANVTKYGTELENIADAAGLTVNVALTATNTTGEGSTPRATSGTAFIGLFRGDTLISYSSIGKSFAASESKSMSFSMTIPSNTDNLAIKAFVCKSIFDLTPLSTNTVVVD